MQRPTKLPSMLLAGHGGHASNAVLRRREEEAGRAPQDQGHLQLHSIKQDCLKKKKKKSQKPVTNRMKQTWKDLG